MNTQVRSHAPVLANMLLAICAAAAVAEPPPKSDERLLNATVVVRAGNDQDPSTGVLVRRQGETGFVLTHRDHVTTSGRPREPLSVLLHSATPQERSVAATVAWIDAQSGVALLKISGRDLPAPIECSRPPSYRPDQHWSLLTLEAALGDGGKKAQYRRVGRPAAVEPPIPPRFGGAGRLKPNQRLDKFGGALVDRGGVLFGYALPAPRDGQLEWCPCILTPELGARLDGALRRLRIVEAPSGAGAPRGGLVIEADIEDPLDQVSSVQFLIGRGDAPASSRPAARSEPRPLPAAMTTRLKPEGGQWRGTLTLEPNLAGSESLLVQVKLNRRAGGPALSEPRPLRLEGSGRGLTDDAAPETIAGEVRFTGRIENALVAGSGRYLVIRLADQPALTVFDVWENRITGTLPLRSTKFAYAAGGDRALVHYPAERDFETWNIHTLEKVRTTAVELVRSATPLAMGHASGDLAALAMMSVAPNGLVAYDIRLLRTDSHEFLAGTPAAFPSEIRALIGNRDLVFVGWSGLVGMGGVARRSGPSFSGFDPTRANDRLPVSAVGDDGTAYTAFGSIIGENGQVIRTVQGVGFSPGLDSPLALGCDPNGRIDLYRAGEATPLAAWRPFPRWPSEPPAAAGPLGSISRRIVFLPQHRRVVVIPYENDRVEVLAFDLKTVLRSAGNEYTVFLSLPPRSVIREREWRYKPMLTSSDPDIDLKLDVGPAGMSLGADGSITWRVPATPARIDEKVLIRARNSAGAAGLQAFVLRAPPPGAELVDYDAGGEHVLEYVK